MEEKQPTSPTPITPVSPVPQQQGVNTTKRRLLAGFAATFIVASVCGFGGGYLGARAHGTVDTSTMEGQQRVISSESQLIATIAKNAGPSVVSINTTSRTASSSSGSLYDYLYGNGSSGRTQLEQAAGTGIILSSDGIIITNRHVVPSGTTSVSVTLQDGTTYDNVQVIGRTSDSDTLDIAFLKIGDTKGKKLAPATLGDSGKMQVGDKVIAIGNTLGEFQNTVTSGIISGYGRNIQAGSADDSENLQGLFQTDAAINEGNSGGPLLNASGQVIGINTAIASDSQNVGFAIPINDVQGLINQVLKTGKFERAYLGVRYIPLDAATADQLNLSQTSGAYIPKASQSGGQGNPIISDSPADKAGLQPGDIITELNGTKINNTTASLSTLLARQQVGDKVSLTVIRDGKTITIEATLAAAPSS